MKSILSHPAQALFLSASMLMGAAAVRGAETEPATQPRVEVFAPDPTALEGASTAAFTVTRLGPTNSALTVNYTLSGTATNGVDYVLIPTTALIPPVFSAADIVIQPIFNPANTANKKVLLTLLTNANYQLGKHKSARVTIINDTFEDQAPSVALVSPANGAGFAYPATIKLEAQATDNDGTVQKVSFYANDDFLGETTSSPYSLVWTNARPGRYALFARAIDTFGKSALSSAVHITVTNVTPTISLLSPTNGAVFGWPANVKLEAEATARNGTIAKVQFFGDSRLLTTLTNAPYSMTWSNVPPGKHTVTARAVDSLGVSASATARFSVTNARPEVHFLSPANGASFTRPASITIKASATDSDGSIKRVSFYANGRLLGRVSQSPYEFTWSNMRAGTYKLAVVASDEFDSKTAPEMPVITVK